MSRVYFVLIFIQLVGCSGVKVKNYTPTAIDRVDPFPTTLELKERARVAIVIDDQGIPLAMQVEASNFIYKEISKILSNIKNIDFIDRKINKGLREEIILSQIRNNTLYNGQDVADYVVLVRIDNLTFDSRYSNNTGAKIGYSALKLGLMTASMMEGRGIYIDGGESPISSSYVHSSSFSGTLSLVAINGVEKALHVPIEGSYSASESADRFSPEGIKKIDHLVILQAIFNSIKGVGTKIKKSIPAVGHIIKRMDRDQGSPAIFQVSFGRSDGLRPGSKVEVERKIYEKNPLNNENEISIKKDVLGKIIKDEFGENFCWIGVKDKIIASQVKIGDKIVSHPE